MFKNLDIKTIFILILAAALVLMFIFRPSKQIDDNEEELNRLKEQNKELFENNEKLKLSNDSLNKHISDIDSSLVDVDNGLTNSDGTISDLEDGKGQISDNVRVLSADGVASELSNYLFRRESKGSN